jgi:hypothetical protein
MIAVTRHLAAPVPVSPDPAVIWTRAALPRAGYCTPTGTAQWPRRIAEKAPDCSRSAKAARYTRGWFSE